MNKVNKSCKILIGITGSVASIKLPELLKTLKIELNNNYEICIISTQSALNFININELNEITSLNDRLNYLNNSNLNKTFIFNDSDEWSSWSKRNDPVLHIDLRKWADLYLISPLDANTLAKLSNGICDNLLTCVARAWDFKKPIIICPAMNTYMYEHVITEQQLNILKNWGYKIIEPIEKLLICGDYGKGAMANVDTIVNTIIKILNNNE